MSNPPQAVLCWCCPMAAESSADGVSRKPAWRGYRALPGRHRRCSAWGSQQRFTLAWKRWTCAKDSRLYGLVRDQLGQDPLGGHLFLFTNRDRTRLKALVWEGSGLWVCAKRLERGRFRWPTASPEARSRGDGNEVGRTGCGASQVAAGMVQAGKFHLVT